jgi:ubiquitin carboxyl-terminal hydrolase 9/13
LTSETKCLTCEKVSQRDEVFLDLSVDLEQHSSVTSCLRKFSAEEMLCERNKFHCDNCGGLQEAEKRMKIKRLPRVLALHLKRFKYTEDLQRLQKLFHRVVYPYHLRLFNTTDDAEDPDRLYELYAVVVHIGGGPYHGHYVAIIKTEDRGWLLFDDELVEPVDKNYVRNFFGDRPGLACAYVLFYQETTLEAVLREQAQEDQAAAAAASETGDATEKPNGIPVTQVHSASQLPTGDSKRPGPLNRILTAPNMPTHTEVLESVSSPGPAQVPLPPIPDSPAPILSPKKSDIQARKEKAREEKREEKARKAEEKEKEKEKERNDKLRRREWEMQQRREAADLKLALELSKADASDIGPENGSPRKSSSFNFLKRSSRSFSHRLNKDKDPRTSTSDLRSAPVHESPVVEPISEQPPVLPPVMPPPVPPKDNGSTLVNPKNSSRPEPIAAKEAHNNNNNNNNHHDHNHDKTGHIPRWRSFSFKKS